MSNSSTTKDLEEDEELAALRLAALLSRKTVKKPQPASESNNYANPISSIVNVKNHNDKFPTSTIPCIKNDHAQPYVQNQHYSWRKQPSRWRSGPVQQTSHRSNLIIINPVPLDNKETSTKLSKPSSSLILPQDKWFHSGTEDSMSPKSFRKMGPTRFNRHESDSDSSDTDVEDADHEDSCSSETILQDEHVHSSTELNSVSSENQVASDLKSKSPGKTANDANSCHNSDEDVQQERTSCTTTESTSFTRDFNDDTSSSSVESEASLNEDLPSKLSTETSTVICEDKKPSANPMNNSQPTNKGMCSKNNEASHSALKVEAYLSSIPSDPESSTTSESFGSAHRTDNSKDSTKATPFHFAKSGNSSSDNTKKQLSHNDLRFALKKKLVEKKAETDECIDNTEDNRSSILFRHRSLSNSSSSSDSTSNSSASRHFAIKSVSSVVRPVHSENGQNMNKTQLKIHLDQSSSSHRSSNQITFNKQGLSTTLESSEPSKGFRNWKDSEKLSKCSSGAKIQLSEASRSCDVAPDDSIKKRVPVHFRLGNLSRKRVIKVTNCTPFSDSSDSNDVNSKCKKQNLQIVAEMYQNETDDINHKKKRKNESDHHSSKERPWKKSAR